MNKVILMGNVGNDPDLRYSKNGSAIANLSLATTEMRGTDYEKTNWHKLVFFGKLAEVVSEYVHKGDKILVSGRVEYRDYEDKEGIRRFVTDITCESFEFCGSKKEAQSENKRSTYSRNQPKRNNGATPPADEDDIPF